VLTAEATKAIGREAKAKARIEEYEAGRPRLGTSRSRRIVIGPSPVISPSLESF